MSLNRLRANKQSLNRFTERVDSATRKARTRTLIQLGGLLSVLGLPNYLGIEEGDDLQLDNEASEKAAILLGMLQESIRNLPDFPECSQLESWRSTGIRILKMHQSKGYS